MARGPSCSTTHRRAKVGMTVEIETDPASFVRALRPVEIPLDCLFSVRFSGETWHQFVLLDARSGHPAFFALSTHTNELGGELSRDLRQRVLADQGDIPSLTQLLPNTVAEYLRLVLVDPRCMPTTALSLDVSVDGAAQRAGPASQAAHLSAGLPTSPYPIFSGALSGTCQPGVPRWPLCTVDSWRRRPTPGVSYLYYRMLSGRRKV
jgi:hypothetical protein